MGRKGEYFFLKRNHPIDDDFIIFIIFVSFFHFFFSFSFWLSIGDEFFLPHLKLVSFFYFHFLKGILEGTTTIFFFPIDKNDGSLGYLRQEKKLSFFYRQQNHHCCCPFHLGFVLFGDKIFVDWICRLDDDYYQ